jgi:hypothetical protein
MAMLLLLAFCENNSQNNMGLMKTLALYCLLFNYYKEFKKSTKQQLAKKMR